MEAKILGNGDAMAHLDAYLGGLVAQAEDEWPDLATPSPRLGKREEEEHPFVANVGSPIAPCCP